MVGRIKSSVRHRGVLAAPILSVLLLAGIVAEKTIMREPVIDARPYHANVQMVADHLPMVIGDWVGTDEPVPVAAVTMLKPNVMISRKFVNIRTGDQASVLLVQCADRRDLLGHYPPVCYPGQGWRIASDNDWNVRINGMTIPIKWYNLVKPSTDNAERMSVGNFMIVPDGRLVRDMTGLGGLSATKSHNQFGAAQMQVVVPGYLTANVRDQIFRELVTGHFSLIQAILTGEVKDETLSYDK